MQINGHSNHVDVEKLDPEVRREWNEKLEFCKKTLKLKGAQAQAWTERAMKHLLTVDQKP